MTYTSFHQDYKMNFHISTTLIGGPVIFHTFALSAQTQYDRFKALTNKNPTISLRPASSNNDKNSNFFTVLSPKIGTKSGPGWVRTFENISIINLNPQFMGPNQHRRLHHQVGGFLGGGSCVAAGCAMCALQTVVHVPDISFNPQ